MIIGPRVHVCVCLCVLLNPTLICVSVFRFVSLPPSIAPSLSRYLYPRIHKQVQERWIRKTKTNPPPKKAADVGSKGQLDAMSQEDLKRAAVPLAVRHYLFKVMCVCVCVCVCVIRICICVCIIHPPRAGIRDHREHMPAEQVCMWGGREGSGRGEGKGERVCIGRRVWLISKTFDAKTCDV